MSYLRRFGYVCALATLGAIATGCGSATEGTEQLDSTTEALNPGQCQRAEPKDVLIAGLVKNSWLAGYPLTRLSVAAHGSVTGVDVPDLVAGDLEIINAVPEARDSVAAAVADIAGLPDYGMAGMGAEQPSCAGVPAWTPNGIVSVPTTEAEYFTGGVNDDSWRAVHMAFGKRCPLVKRLGNRDVVDPPGDGSTNEPASTTVSSTGVRANALQLCPAGTPVGTYCKLYSSTGVNYTGRTCQLYYGRLICALSY